MTTEKNIPDGHKVCPSCDGVRRVVVGMTVGTSFASDESDPPEQIDAECDHCDALGFVPDDDADDSDESDSDMYDYDDREYDDSMDGDHESALASAGFGTDEDYGGASDFDADFE